MQIYHWNRVAALLSRNWNSAFTEVLKRGKERLSDFQGNFCQSNVRTLDSQASTEIFGVPIQMRQFGRNHSALARSEIKIVIVIQNEVRRAIACAVPGDA